MKKTIIIDRIESNKAVCLCGDKKVLIPLSDFLFQVKEGDVLIKNNNIFVKDEMLTQKLREDNIKLQNSVFDD